MQMLHFAVHERHPIIIILCITWIIASSSTSPAADDASQSTTAAVRERILIDNDWRFTKDDPPASTAPEDRRGPGTGRTQWSPESQSCPSARGLQARYDHLARGAANGRRGPLVGGLLGARQCSIERGVQAQHAVQAEQLHWAARTRTVCDDGKSACLTGGVIRLDEHAHSGGGKEVQF